MVISAMLLMPVIVMPVPFVVREDVEVQDRDNRTKGGAWIAGQDVVCWC